MSRPDEPHLLYALQEERAGVSKHLSIPHTSSLIGLGMARARGAILALLEENPPPKNFVLVGISGGCTDIPFGEVIEATDVANGQTGEWISLSKSRSIPTRIVTVKDAAETEAEKRMLSTRFGAVAVDMESFAVAQAFAEKGRLKELSIVRAIFDPVDQDIRLLIRYLEKKLRPIEFLNPALWAQFWHAHRAFNQCSRKLAHAVTSACRPAESN